MKEENFGPTLTNVTYMGRQTVKFGAFFLVFLIFGRVFLNGAIALYKAMNPPKPAPPTVGFGKLPPIVFPSQTSSDKPVSYSLETPTGQLPQFGDRAKVFFMPKTALSLLADQGAKKIAANYGFETEPEILSTEVYRWNALQPFTSSFELNIRNNNFKLTTDFLSRPELLSTGQAITGFEAVNRVKSYLRQGGLMPPDMATASGEIVYLKSLGGILEPAVSQSDADFIQVDLNRFPVDGQYRMFTEMGYKGTVSAIVSGASKGSDSIVAIEKSYNTIDYSEVHTYPLRSIRSAWDLLQAGEGYIVDKGKTDNAIVRKVYLAYFDSFEQQDYLQPIYVFENPDDGFLAFVSALDPSYIQVENDQVQQ